MAILNYLLMTSAVAPSDKTPYQVLLDPEIRFNQTLVATNKWLRLARRHDFHIILADNSGWASKLAAQIPRKDLNNGVISIVDLPRPSEEILRRGKGAAEAETILLTLQQYGFEDSRNIAKVNARYFATNGMYLVKSVDEPFQFAAWPGERLASIDSTFFLSKMDFLKDLCSKLVSEIHDASGDYFEIVSARHTIQNNSCDFQMFPYSPAIAGQSGTTGSSRSRWSEGRMVSNLVRLRKYCLERILR